LASDSDSLLFTDDGNAIPCMVNNGTFFFNSAAHIATTVESTPPDNPITKECLLNSFSLFNIKFPIISTSFTGLNAGNFINVISKFSSYYYSLMYKYFMVYIYHTNLRKI